ncbi:BPSL0067 family protein [Rugamonas rubra]|uniref:BPSL0067 family protein n=1 Tax=Rugamonas rubra TaxID=758825 RepID=A0A1I4SVP3_9BURK|nr:BPSL0067 family protein [Rugamonas rubra]SFM68514.1 hypothetical protein SAMN02982985_04937 [Rugamonas rubra]
MSYVYSDARKLELKDKIGDFECVTLIRHFTRAPNTAAWREGAKVLGNKNLAEGTAVATFVDGKWPGKAHGNHSAFYLGQVSDGIYLLDQWPNMETKQKISKRFIRSLGKDKKGNCIRPTENADAYSVIE